MVATCQEMCRDPRVSVVGVDDGLQRERDDFKLGMVRHEDTVHHRALLQGFQAEPIVVLAITQLAVGLHECIREAKQWIDLL